MKIKFKSIHILAFVLVIVGIVYFVSQNSNSKEHEVVLGENGFSPKELTIQKGDRVKFRSNLDDPFWPASDPHPLHTVFSAFDPKKPVNPEAFWEFRFSKLGEWTYHDHLFPAYKGKITVLSKNTFESRNKILTRDEVLKLINKNGPEKTYLELKKIYDPSGAFAHTTVHLFGEVLYTKFGLSGINYCDNFAGFGCYHGHFIKAVSDKGLDIAIELDKKCVEKFGPMGLGCPHGIGHGLVEYFGLGKVKEALTICAKLSWQGPLFGCSGGVFMENNFPTVFDKNGVGKVTTREPGDNLFEPCQNLDSKFKQSCYFEQASYWNSVLNSDYDKIGKLCLSLGVVNQREACLLGMGNSIVEVSAYNANTLLLGCSKLQDKHSQAICVAGGSWAFFSNPDKRNESEGICRGLSTYEKLCMDRRILVK